MTVFLSLLSLMACSTSGAVTLGDEGLTEGGDNGENGENGENEEEEEEEEEEADPIEYSGTLWGYVPEWDDWVFCEGEVDLTVEGDGEFEAETLCDAGRGEVVVEVAGEVEKGEVEGDGMILVESGGDVREDEGELYGEWSEQQMVMAFEAEMRFRGRGNETYEADAVFYFELYAE